MILVPNLVSVAFFHKPTVHFRRSPDVSWSGMIPNTKAATPTGGSRRDSIWSTISMIKSKLGGGRSNTSFENIREERNREGFLENVSNDSSPLQVEVSVVLKNFELR